MTDAPESDTARPPTVSKNSAARPCEACGEVERVAHLEDGECRECRDADVRESPDHVRGGYVSPDDVERSGDWWAHHDEATHLRGGGE